MKGPFWTRTYRGSRAIPNRSYGEVAPGVPLGRVRKSGYNRTDVHLNYHVPGIWACRVLGLKRGLAEDLVIRSLCHGCCHSWVVPPESMARNLQRLAAEGRAGVLTVFYEAVDYTPSRLPPGQTSATIRSFMGHHQGMGLLALALPAAGPADAKAIPFLPGSSSMRSVAAGARAANCRKKSFRRISEVGRIAASWQPAGRKRQCEIFTNPNFAVGRKFTFCPMAVITWL